jgi:D-alanyl-D-alanine carboxypeptidase
MEINNSISDSTLPMIKNSRVTRLPKFKKHLNNRNQARAAVSKRKLERPKRYFSKPLEGMGSTSVKPKEQHLRSLNHYLFYKPHISAASWIAIEAAEGRYLDGRNEDEVREIASLTKIMTCITAIQEILHHKRSFEEIVHVSQTAANIDGTIADLQAGDEIKLWDLLYALMLPSGNDAAVAISEFIGKLADPGLDPTEAFVNKMNQNSKALNLHDTIFTNPHGMSTTINLSSARSVAALACYSMKLPLFSKIVSTKSHKCNIFNPNGTRKVEWVNTNILLDKGYCGVKTGITPAAGPCLCFCMQRRKKKLLVVLLNSNSMESRWREAVKLWKYTSLHLLH